MAGMAANQDALLVERRLVLLRDTGDKKRVDAMKNYDGGRTFATPSNGSVSIGRTRQEKRTWNGSGTRTIHISQRA